MYQLFKSRLFFKITSTLIVCLLLFNGTFALAGEATSNSAHISAPVYQSDQDNKAALKAILICKYLDKYAETAKSVNGIYMDEIVLWAQNIVPSDRKWMQIFRGCRITILPGEIIIYLPDSDVCIRYYDTAPKTPLTQPKEFIPDMDRRSVKTGTIPGGHIRRQIYYNATPQSGSIDLPQSVGAAKLSKDAQDSGGPDEQEWQEGDSVESEKFGRGRIYSTPMSGAGRLIVVRFRGDKEEVFTLDNAAKELKLVKKKKAPRGDITPRGLLNKLERLVEKVVKLSEQGYAQTLMDYSLEERMLTLLEDIYKEVKPTAIREATRERYASNLLTLSLAFPSKITGWTGVGPSERAEEILKKFLTVPLGDKLDGYVGKSALDPGAIYKLQSGSAIVVKPFKSLGELRQLQERFSTVELDFTIVRRGRRSPLVVLSRGTEVAAKIRFTGFRVDSRGHTHRFLVPLKPSQQDRGSETDFILAFGEHPNEYELAVRDYKRKKWMFENDETQIESQLREFGLLSSRRRRGNINLPGSVGAAELPKDAQDWDGPEEEGDVSKPPRNAYELLTRKDSRTVVDLMTECSIEQMFGMPQVRKSLEGQDVLILGCRGGPYAFASVLKGANKAIGIDIDEHSIAVAKALAPFIHDPLLRYGLMDPNPYVSRENAINIIGHVLENQAPPGFKRVEPDNMEFIPCDARDLSSTGSNSVDAVAIPFLLATEDGILDNDGIRSTVQEAIRVIKPGGTLFIRPLRSGAATTTKEQLAMLYLEHLVEALKVNGYAGKKLINAKDDHNLFMVVEDTSRPTGISESYVKQSLPPATSHYDAAEVRQAHKNTRQMLRAL